MSKVQRVIVARAAATLTGGILGLIGWNLGNTAGRALVKKLGL